MVRDDMKCVCDEFLLCEMREIFSYSLRKQSTLYKQTTLLATD